MDREEFRRIFDESYWHWCSREDRKESSWWVSVEEFAAQQYERAYREEVRS